MANQYHSAGNWLLVIGIIIALIGGYVYYYEATYLVDGEYALGFGIFLFLVGLVLEAIPSGPSGRRRRR